MSFSTLPPELLSMICGYCDVSELKSLRATNRILAAIIPRKKLFSEALLYMTQVSLEYIQNVAQDKDIAQSVQSLWIQGDYPEPIKNFNDFEDGWKTECAARRYSVDVLNVLTQLSVLREEKKWLGTTEYERREVILRQRLDAAKAAVFIEKIPKTRLRACLRQHKKLQKDVVRIQAGYAIRKALLPVFQECTNLHSIHYTMANCIRKTTTRRNKQFAESLLSPFGQPVSYINQGVDGVRQIILAASDAEFSPRELRLGDVSSLVLAIPSLFAGLPSFVKNIEILEWHFGYAIDFETNEINEEEQDETIYHFRLGLFFNFIRNAVKLRELVIELPFNTTQFYEEPFTLSSLLEDLTFAYLTKFHVLCMWADFEELYDFFMRHAETLEDVFLTEWSLIDGLWSELFIAIAGKLKNLKQFELRGVFRDEFICPQWFGTISGRPTKYGVAISRYVKGEIEDYPTMESAKKTSWRGRGPSAHTPARRTPSPLYSRSDDEDTVEDTTPNTPSDDDESIEETKQEDLQLSLT